MPAGCFTMALNAILTQSGTPPAHLETGAVVHLQKEGNVFSIPTIELTTTGVVPGIDQATFERLAGEAERNCPVSKALAGVKISLQATLQS